MEASGLEGKFDAREGLQVLLTVKEIRIMHGRLQSVDLLQQTHAYATRRMEAAKTSPEIAQVWNGYARIAEQLLVIERKRVPIPTSLLDAEPRIVHGEPGSQPHIELGGGPQEGGYAMSLNSGRPLRW